MATTKTQAGRMLGATLSGGEAATVAAVLAGAREKARGALQDIEDLERRLLRAPARGTRDVAPAARKAIAAATAAVEPTAPKHAHREAPIAERVEVALRANVLGLADLARAIGAPELGAARAVKALGARVVDVGDRDTGARYSWVAGDDGPTGELNDLVERLLRVRPMAFSEVIAFTGAREKRCSGAIVRLQRDPRTAKKLANRGDARRALWFLRR